MNKNKRTTSKSKRIVKKLNKSQPKRAYDIAKSMPSSDWISAKKSNANEETKSAIAPGREKARALVQNAPYATKSVDVIVTETVGSGVAANIKGRNKSLTKELNKLWKELAETTACDFDGRHNFYALQELAMRTTVESGEGLALKKFSRNGPQLQLIESDYIDTNKDDGNIVQGIELDGSGKRSKYHLFKRHPGGKNPTTETYSLPVDEVLHVYKQTRPGQLRGVTWAHAVVEKLKDFDDYQYATLIRQKSAACFGGVVTTNGQDNILDPDVLKARREAQFQWEPNTWRFLNPGEDIKLVTPPSFDDSNFNRETLRAIASGWGITYESMTGDYSQSNYSSSRMGREQMKKNIESWRWNMFIPQFCDPYFKWFLEWAQMRGVDITGATVEWVPPAYTTIDPTKDIPALIKEVRAGFKTWDEAVLELGRDPESTILKIAEWNKRFDEHGIALDIDPRKITQVGLSQSTDPNALKEEKQQGQNSEEQDQTDASGQSDQSDS